MGARNYQESSFYIEPKYKTFLDFESLMKYENLHIYWEFEDALQHFDFKVGLGLALCRNPDIDDDKDIFNQVRQEPK